MITAIASLDSCSAPVFASDIRRILMAWAWDGVQSISSMIANKSACSSFRR